MAATGLTARIRHWWLARLPRSDVLQLTQRNVYLLPTGAGAMLALTLLVLLMASINFQLNLGYLLTFVLTACACAGVLIGHATLRGLQLQLAPPEPVFSGQTALLRLALHNARRTPRRAIALALHEGDRREDAHWAWADVPGQGQVPVQLACPAYRRGLQPLPALVVQTRYPLGTFRVWALWRPAATLLVYPPPEPHPPPLPVGLYPSSQDTGALAGNSGDYDGVRAWRRGDPLKTLAWKKAARTLATGSGTLVSRERAARAPRQLWLDASACGLAEREALLARLTAWVLQADQRALHYGLRLPGVEIAPASGAEQRLRCLRALALYGF